MSCISAEAEGSADGVTEGLGDGTADGVRVGTIVPPAVGQGSNPQRCILAYSRCFNKNYKNTENHGSDASNNIYKQCTLNSSFKE